MIIVLTIALAWLAGPAAAEASFMKTMTVPSEAMVPTIPVGGSIDVRVGAYQYNGVKFGDIVIVTPPAEAERVHDRLGAYCGDRHRRPGQMCVRAKPGLAPVLYIKRVVGLPGDRLSLRRGRLYRNGRPVEEPYVAPCDDRELCRFPTAITIPRGRYYLMGDNRGNSFDSRLWGPTPKRALVGRVEGCTPAPPIGCPASAPPS